MRVLLISLFVVCVFVCCLFFVFFAILFPQPLLFSQAVLSLWTFIYELKCNLYLNQQLTCHHIVCRCVSLNQSMRHIGIFVPSMLLVFSVQFLTPPLISVRKEATDSALIASGPTAAQWSADKAAGQQRPHSVLREKGMVMLSTDQRTAA